MKKGMFFEGIKNGNKKFIENITIIVNSVLLSIVYFFGIGFTFFMSRIFNKKFLETKIEKDKDNYWKELNLSTKPLGEYCRQF